MREDLIDTAETNDSQTSTGLLNSVVKSIRTLQTFTVSKPEWTLTQLSRELNISKSTMANILKTLQSFGYVTKSPSQYYHLGVDLLELSYHLRASLPILHIAIPVMEDIQRQTGQIVYLTIPKKGKVFYLQSVNPGNRNISYSITGKCSFMHADGGGKAMLSTMIDEEIDTIIRFHGLPRFTANTITDIDKLKQDLHMCRQRGYAIDNCEDMPHVKSVAVPIVSSNRLLGALSLSGAAIAMNEEQFPYWAELLSSATSLFASYEEMFPYCGILP